jgi:GGDEF domain-containing protein
VAMQGKAIRNKPASMDIARKLRPQDEIELNSSLVVPLVLDGRTVGTISLYSGALHFYTEEHLRLLTIVADHAVSAIENARCFERTRELALTDALTGLPNARALASRLARAIGACGGDKPAGDGRLPPDDPSPEMPAADKQPLALVLIDMDNFKVVNDRLGHVVGDRVLRDVAEILVREAGASRTPDPEPNTPFVSRYAGDEFVVVLPGADRAQARAVAAGIQRRLLEYRLNEAPGTLADSWNATGRRGDAARHLVTAEGRVLWSGASAGVALFPEDAPDARALIHCADQRMYRDKFARKRETEKQASGRLPTGATGGYGRGQAARTGVRAASIPAVALRADDEELLSSTGRAPLS